MSIIYLFRSEVASFLLIFFVLFLSAKGGEHFYRNYGEIGNFKT